MQSKIITLFAMFAILPFVADDAFATNNYFGAYPDEAQRDASYVYLTVDMTGVTSSVTGDTLALASTAHATSGDVLTGYVSQVMILYDDSQNDIELHSEVYGVDSSGNLDDDFDCEIQASGCQDLGTASTIVDMAAQTYWSGGDVQFYVFVDYTESTPSDYFVNEEYDPGSNPNESPTQFQSGTVTNGGYKYKLTQWGVESLNNSDNWTIELSGMYTWTSSAGTKQFSADTAKTTDFTAGSTDGSYITYRTVSGSDVRVLIGAGDHCVHRIGNTDGILEFEEASSSCLAVPTTLWS